MSHLETFETDCLIIGAGAIGLATAREFAEHGHETLLIEKEAYIAAHTSSRNSEVIHAGFYYPENSLKAKACVFGLQKLYEYLKAHHLPFEKCGKLVVATNAEEAARLEKLQTQAECNEVPNTEIISGDAAKAKEPSLSENVCAALWSPDTGIFDSHAYFLSLQGDVEKAGGNLILNTPFESAEFQEGYWLSYLGGDMPCKVKSKYLINCGGHHAVQNTAMMGFDKNDLPVDHYVKGEYFYVTGKAPFSSLIYPMPSETSLGLHYTKDLQNRARFGPSAIWLKKGTKPPFDYNVDEANATGFVEAIARYWPDIRDRELQPGYAGVRPKVVAKGEASGDFKLEGESAHGLHGLINCFGIESPGLTSSLVLAEMIFKQATTS